MLFSTVGGMERVWPTVDTTDEIWASLLIRAVAYLADRISDDTDSTEVGGCGEAEPYGPDAAEDDQAYRAWLAAYAEKRDGERAANRRELSHHRPPGISVVVGGNPVEPDLCARSLASARDQDLPVTDVVEALTPELDLADSWNAGASRASGDFLAFVEAGDELEPGVLADVALTLAGDPEIDLAYTDSDSLNQAGERIRPFFKPGWAPDQLLSHMYLGRLTVVRRSLFESIGGFRSGFGQSHEYDFALRASERARRIVRVPVVGYHRRSTPAESAGEGANRALEAALRRRGEEAEVEPGLCPGTYRLRRPVSTDALVSVIVPFHNGAEHLRRCVRSLQQTAGHDRWEAILVDNRSWDPNTRALLARTARDPRVRVISYPGSFNWAAINNRAVKESTGAHLLFMNADVEGRSDGWMDAMLEHSQRPEIGAVGARLLYPDGRVQHAGVVMGLGGGVAWHIFCNCPESSSGYFDQAKVIRNCSAVTGACMMVRRDAFERLGGFSEDLAVAYNDVDFCLRLQHEGYRVVYTPFAELVHDESQTRGRMPPDRHAVDTMTARWGDWIRCDPYFNPNLDRYRAEGVVAGPEGGIDVH